MLTPIDGLGFAFLYLAIGIMIYGLTSDEDPQSFPSKAYLTTVFLWLPVLLRSLARATLMCTKGRNDSNPS